MIVTSNKPFSAWGEIFGDDMAATAMIDRLIHHAEILSLKGDSYRLRGKDLDARIARKDPPKSPDRSPSAPPPRPADGVYGPRDRAKAPNELEARRRRRIAATASRYGLRASASTAAYPSHPISTRTRVGHFSTGAGGPLFDRP